MKLRALRPFCFLRSPLKQLIGIPFSIFVSIFICFMALATPVLSLSEKADSFFTKGQYAEALPLYLQILKNVQSSPKEQSIANCRTGIIHSIQGKNSEARGYIERSIAITTLPRKLESVCLYALLQVYVIENENQEAQKLIMRMGELDLPESYVARSLALSLEVGDRLKDFELMKRSADKLVAYMDALKIVEVETKVIGKKFTKASIQETVQKAQTLDKPKAVSAQSSSNSSNRSQNLSPQQAKELSSSLSKALLDVSLGKGAAALQALKAERKTEQTGEALSKSGLSMSVAKVANRLQRLSEDPSKVMRVGVVVPSGVSFSRFKHKVLRSISAFAASSAVKGVDYSFFVKPVSTDPGSIEENVLSLLLDDHVHALIGPLTSSQAMAALPLCELLAVPLFSFGPVTWGPDLRSLSLVRMGILAKSQARAHLNHLSKDPKFKKFSVLAPNDPYGMEMAQAFNDVVGELSLSLHRVTYFDMNKEVFNEPVSLALGPQGRETREAEFLELEKELRAKATAEKRKFDPSQLKLPAKPPFDALFVPDTVQRAKVIASTFAFLDAKTVRYLGDRTWAESTSKPSVADEYLNGALIPVPENGPFAPYLRRVLKLNSLSTDLESQVFDSLMMLRQAQFKSSGNDGKKLIQSMRDSAFVVQGSTKISAVDAKGEPGVEMSLWTYHNGKVVAGQTP